MTRRLTLVCAICGAILLINSAVLAAFPTTATIFGIGNVLLHIVLGAVVGVLALMLLRTERRLISIVIAAASGVLLVLIGNTRDHKAIFLIHVVISLVAVAILFARRESFLIAKVSATAAALVLVAGICYRLFVPHPEEHIVNSRTVPLSMYQEGAGPKSPFFPSGANTSDGRLVPSTFFMESKKCGECHKDIYEQWKSSAHHFASFNNQFYRKSIEYMQAVVGTQAEQVVRRLSRSCCLLQRTL